MKKRYTENDVGIVMLLFYLFKLKMGYVVNDEDFPECFTSKEVTTIENEEAEMDFGKHIAEIHGIKIGQKFIEKVLELNRLYMVQNEIIDL